MESPNCTANVIDPMGIEQEFHKPIGKPRSTIGAKPSFLYQKASPEHNDPSKEFSNLKVNPQMHVKF